MPTVHYPVSRFLRRERVKTVKINSGKTVTISYDLTVEGKLVKCISSQKPLRYTHGKKQVLKGLEKSLKGLKAGDKKDFDLTAKEGYGLENPKLIMEMDKKRFPKMNHIVGKQIVSREDGKFMATVKAVKPNTLVLNFNHPLAGKKLYFNVVILNVQGKYLPSKNFQKKGLM